MAASLPGTRRATSRQSPPTPVPTRPTPRPARRSCSARRRRPCPTLAAQASPITHVSAAAPPFLLLHGARDRFIPCAQSERLHQALVTVGADVELHLYDDADHMWLGAPEPPQQALDRTINFLRRHLAPRPTDKEDNSMRIVGIRRDGGPVRGRARCPTTATQVTVLAALEEFWADAAGHLSREPAGRDGAGDRRSSSCRRCCPAPG